MNHLLAATMVGTRKTPGGRTIAVLDGSPIIEAVDE
jgi:hypothetical protein